MPEERLTSPDRAQSEVETPRSFDFSDAEFRRLGEATLSVMLAAVRADREDPVLAPVRGSELRALLDEPLPAKGCSPDSVVAAWQDVILPHCRSNGHPRFFAYVCTSPDPVGIFADAMASALNQAVTAWRSSPGAAEVERLVLRWLDQMVGFEGGGSGLLVSGGSSANFHALACAVHRAEVASEPALRQDMTVYMSREAHVSLRKAARLLGIPQEQIRLLEVDSDRRLLLDHLYAQVGEDRSRGLRAVAVCTSAGTANTGAIDPLEEVADFCAAEGIWHHVDGAYGAPAVVTEDFAWMARVFRRADSLSLDPHKWLFAPADVGCLLLRDEAEARATFAWDSEYTSVTQTDAVEGYAFFDHGLEMTRRFRGLKVWSILKARGLDGIREVIERNIRLREHLDRRILDEERMQGLGSELSIACFRYIPAAACAPEVVDAINRRIVERVVHDGHAYFSPTTLDGVYALRACIVNFRTTFSDVDGLVDEILRLGREFEVEGAPQI